MTETYYKETTVWEDNTPNHTYVLNEQGKCVGYITEGRPMQRFTKPKMFSKSNRKFNKLSSKEVQQLCL